NIRRRYVKGGFSFAPKSAGGVYDRDSSSLGPGLSAVDRAVTHLLTGLFISSAKEGDKIRPFVSFGSGHAGLDDVVMIARFKCCFGAGYGLFSGGKISLHAIMATSL